MKSIITPLLVAVTLSSGNAFGQASLDSEELARLSFNVNMKMIEVLKRSNRLEKSSTAVSNLVDNGCDIDSIQNLLTKGYAERSSEKIRQADICLAKLAIALGYSDKK
jgi:hypothetical protein